MATASFIGDTLPAGRWHPFGAHGILLALPLSLALWTLILAPFM